MKYVRALLFLTALGFGAYRGYLWLQEEDRLKNLRK